MHLARVAAGASGPIARLQRLARRGYRPSARAFNHCVDIVRQQDKERYLCNLSAPSAARPALFALHAFNLETSRVRGSTSELNLGRMRFTWWRQTVRAAMRGEPPDNPIAQALAGAHAQHGLTERFLQQIVDAREADLETKQPQNMRELTAYCEQTAGAVMQLGLEACGVPEEEEKASVAAYHVGVAHGLVTVLRATIHHAGQGCTYIPADVAHRHGLTLKSILSGSASPALTDAATEIGLEATTHLLAARALRPDLSPAARAALQPAAVVGLVLGRLQQHGYNIYSREALQPLGLRLQASLAWHGAFGTY